MRPGSFLLGCSLVLAASCGGGSSVDVDAPDGEGGDGAGEAEGEPDGGGGEGGGVFELTVDGGHGSGRFEAGARVHVFADVDPATEIVTGWLAEGLDETPPAEWRLELTMPASDVTLRPTISVSGLDLEERTAPGVAGDRELFVQIPPDAKGVVFLFHGTGGSARFITKVQPSYVAAVLVHHGYVVVGPGATEADVGDQNGDGKIRWDSRPSVDANVDLQDIALYSQWLTDLGAVAADAPRYALGMSNGGAFAVTVGASDLEFDAVVSFCATGRDDAIARTTTPTAWFMCENDSNETVSAKRDEWPDGSAALADRGVRTAYAEHGPSPIYDERLARVSGVTAERSAAAVAELRAAGHLDEEGFLMASPDAVIRAVQASPDDFPVLAALGRGPTAAPVRAELRAAYAEHQMFDDWAYRTLAFFEGR